MQLEELEGSTQLLTLATRELKIRILLLITDIFWTTSGVRGRLQSTCVDLSAECVDLGLTWSRVGSGKKSFTDPEQQLN
jgi:hypothetical protein